MKKKKIFSLTVTLVALLLTGCRDLVTSSKPSTSGELIKVDIIGSDLPALSDSESWPLPFKTTLQLAGTGGGDLMVATDIVSTYGWDYEFYIYTDGFKGEASLIQDDLRLDGSFYCYHADGVTYLYNREPIWEDDELTTEIEYIERWTSAPDPDLEIYNERVGEVVEDFIEDSFVMFEYTYLKFAALITEDDFSAMEAEIAEDFPEGSEISYRFYKEGIQYIFEVNASVTFEQLELTSSQKVILEFAGDRPGALIIEASTEGGPEEFSMLHATAFTYTDNRPAYSGPYMPAE